MSDTQPRRFKWQRPTWIHFVIALLLALLIVERVAAYLYEPRPGSKEIILYTTDWCGYCEALRVHLKAHDIPYIERDVEKSLSGLLGWWTVGGRGVPVSVVGEQVVYGYQLDKIDEGLITLGYDMKEQPPTEHAGNTEENDLPGGSMDGDIAIQEAVTEANCVPAEVFEDFYAAFKADEEFKFERTRFPLRKRVFSGSGSRQTEEVFAIEKDQILAKDELVYLDQMSASSYSEGIYMNDESQVDIRTGPEDLDPLTIHRFHSVSGCWFLYEFVSYEYSGSTNILAL
jgi:glutaredoxin